MSKRVQVNIGEVGAGGRKVARKQPVRAPPEMCPSAHLLGRRACGPRCVGRLLRRKVDGDSSTTWESLAWLLGLGGAVINISSSRRSSFTTRSAFRRGLASTEIVPKAADLVDGGGAQRYDDDHCAWLVQA